MFKTGVQFKAGVLQIQPEFRHHFADRGYLDPDRRTTCTFWRTVPVRNRISPACRAGSYSSSRCTTGKESCRGSLSQRLARADQRHHSRHGAYRHDCGGDARAPNTFVPGATGCAVPLPTGGCSIRGFFPRGIQNFYPQNVWTTEIQLPTPWVTLVAKFYKGDDMRFFFGGNSTTSSPTSTAPPKLERAPLSAAEPSCLAAPEVPVQGATLNCNGNPINVSKLQPIGGLGGFAEMSFPLFPHLPRQPGRYNSGWVLHLTLQHRPGQRGGRAPRKRTGSHRSGTQVPSPTKLNKWVTFVDEVSYINTRAATAHSKLFAGQLVTQAHNWRNELGPCLFFSSSEV